MNLRRISTICLLAALAPATAWAVTAEPVGIGGSLGTTDNVLLRSDGTSGKMAQGQSIWSLTDTGALTATGGTVTDNTPLLQLNQTWNDGTENFQAVVINVIPTASAAGSNPFEVRINGQTEVAVRKDGALLLYDAAESGFARIEADSATTNFYDYGGSLSQINVGAISASSLSITNNSSGLSFRSGATTLFSDANDTFDQRRSTNAQSYRLYETYTNSTNYERGVLAAGGDAIELRAETAGTGADDLDVKLTAAGTGSVVATTPFQSLRKVVNDTDGGTYTAADCRGQVYTNTGAVGQQTINLPPVVAGLHITVVLSSTGDVNLNPDNADQILVVADNVGNAISSDQTIGSRIELVGIDTTNWIVIEIAGTWQDVN